MEENRFGLLDRPNCQRTRKNEIERKKNSEKKNEIGKKGKKVSCLAREVRRTIFSQKKNHINTTKSMLGL